MYRQGIKPLISIIVPVYKVEDFIDTCIQSILNQTYTTWELILVDDGSPDRCPQICDDYATKDQRIKVIHKENGGLSSARNVGLDNMTGEYVTFLDSDDFFHPQYLEILLKTCIENQADISQCGFVRGVEKTFPIINTNEKIEVVDNYDIFLKGYAKIIVCAKLYKTHLFDEIRMPLGKINEDDFTTWKCYFNSTKIVITNRQLYYYTINNQSIMATSKKQPRLDFMEAYEERIAFFQEKKEKSMEDYSRMHFCKALLLTYENKMLTKEQRKCVFINFQKNWSNVKHSKYVPLHLKTLFYMFNMTPRTISSILSLKK